MRLDMADAVTGQGRHSLQGADLVCHHLLDIGRAVAADPAAPETPEIEEGGMGTDGDAFFTRQSGGIRHDDGIAGMKAAGQIGG